MAPYTCRKCLAETWNDCDECDECIEESRSDADIMTAREAMPAELAALADEFSDRHLDIHLTWMTAAGSSDRRRLSLREQQAIAAALRAASQPAPAPVVGREEARRQAIHIIDPEAANTESKLLFEEWKARRDSALNKIDAILALFAAPAMASQVLGSDE